MGNSDSKNLYGKAYVDRYRLFPISRITRLLGYMTLSSEDDVVDFACGDGRLLQLIAEKVHSYSGVDFSEEMIAQAVEMMKAHDFQNAEFYCDDIEKFCQRNPHRFDCGFAFDFSEHLFDNEWLEILNHIKKTLKSGARFYIHTPNGEFFMELMKSKAIFLRQQQGHVAVRSPDENIALLEKAGFSIKNVHLLPHYNVLRKIHFLSSLPVIGKHFRARILIEAAA